MLQNEQNKPTRENRYNIEAKVNKFIIEGAYLRDYLYLKYPDFGEKITSE